MIEFGVNCLCVQTYIMSSKHFRLQIVATKLRTIVFHTRLSQIVTLCINMLQELPVGDSVRAGKATPKQIVAVVRPACFTSSTPSKKLDQKHIVKMDGEEMVMVVTLKSSDKNVKSVCSQRMFPTSCKGISGLYIFPLGSKFPNLFKKAGTYKFSFSIVSIFLCSSFCI